MRVDSASRLRIGGITPMTTVDYPGQLAAVIFCQGCPWRCRYCHNGHLLDRDQSTALDWRTVEDLLDRRRGLLDAVVFSGGEPTAQSAIKSAVEEVKARGFRVGLHTNGAYPERLAMLVNDLDWIGLDIKALSEDYPDLTGVPGSGRRTRQSLELLLSADTPFDVRITVHDRLLPAAKLSSLVHELADVGIGRPVLQRCGTESMLDPGLGPNSFDPARTRQTRAV